MSDAAARREARRRRILENSENRLKIITGLNKDIETHTLGKIKTISINNELESANPAVDFEVEHLGGGISITEPSLPIHGSSRDAVSSLTSEDLPKSSASHVDEKQPQDLHLHAKAQGDSLGSLEEGAKASQSLLARFLACRAHLVLLASLVRLLFMFDYGFLFYESIFVPFFTLQLMRVSGIVSNADSTEKNTSALHAALMLSGIPANRIALMNKIFTFVKDPLQDFYIYFFSFIIFHVFCEFL